MCGNKNYIISFWKWISINNILFLLLVRFKIMPKSVFRLICSWLSERITANGYKSPHLNQVHPSRFVSVWTQDHRRSERKAQPSHGGRPRQLRQLDLHTMGQGGRESPRECGLEAVRPGVSCPKPGEWGGQKERERDASGPWAAAPGRGQCTSARCTNMHTHTPSLTHIHQHLHYSH